MAEPRSLHNKASSVQPDLKTSPTTIIVAILRAGNDPSGDLQQTDFMWIKCKASITVEKLYRSYNDRREATTPWVLKYGGNLAEMGMTVGMLNTFGDKIVVFEAVDVSAKTQVAKSPSKVLGTGNPLSPKDTNTQLRATSIPSRSTTSRSGDENTPSPSTLAIEKAIQDSKSAVHTKSGHLREGIPERISATPIDRVISTQPSLNPQTRQTPKKEEANAPPARVGSDRFDGYDGYQEAWFSRFKVAYPAETQDQLNRRLWSSWQSMSEEERSAFGPSPNPASTIGEDSSSNRPNPPPLGNALEVAKIAETPGSIPEIDEQKQKQKHFQLSAMLKDASPQILEASVEASLELLDSLRAPLANKMTNSPDAEQWIAQINSLKQQAVKTKTVIGVVGNTGAGKSSVINAMLDEERLVPTNCMRACTAVVTEISYNYHQQPYCAEIEFISAEDWAKELNVLFQDLLDGDGKVSRECANEDTDAGVAYAKIKAVYPQKTKEDISNSSIDGLLREVSHILGNKRDIKEHDSLIFYKKLQTYVDSKEKSTGKKDKDGRKEKREREFWPLIRVVRLYVKSPALATGAVIVDLPGVHDANAARAAVAEGYMKQCTGLWIVAPINRAVDDKAAKSLLGESFKRQLKMDGGFSAVTFICSKTDDISLTEAQDSLGLDEEMGPSWDEVDHLSAKQKDLKNQLEEFRETKAVYEDVANDVDEQIEVWETLKESLTDGGVVFAPKSKSTNKKRKSTSRKRPPRKKRKTDSSDIEDSDFNDKESDDDEDSIGSDEEAPADVAQDRKPLTKEQILAKLQELKTMKKDSRVQKREITEKTAEIRKGISEVRDAESRIYSEMSALCISGRNQYSKGAIQQDFAAGIKELDQEIAAEEDEDRFDPDAEVRDYDEVAKNLAVFCVSSRGYQKLQGRLRKDPPVPGFTTIEETEIPALQHHCEKLTEIGRAENCRIFINKLDQLLNSLTLWASSDGTGANLTAEQKAREARYLQKGFESLETELENANKASTRELNNEFENCIFDKFEAAIHNAARDAIDTALKWGAPVNRQDRAAGGLYWATYKAVCRRNGSFTNSQGLHDWNAQLAEPMMKILAPGWEKTFTRRIQLVIKNFTTTVPAVLKKFHHDIEARVRKVGAGIAGLSMLAHQVSVYEQLLKNVASTTKDMIIARQKDINREFVPVIQEAMQPSYGWCTEEHGSGCFARMKIYMNKHVSEMHEMMFQKSADEVKCQLSALVQNVRNTLDDKIDEVIIQIKRDYRSVLGGGDMSQVGEVLPRVQRQVRKEIKHMIEDVENMMRKVVGLEPEDSTHAYDVRGIDTQDEDGAPNHASAESTQVSQSEIKTEANPTPWQLAPNEEAIQDAVLSPTEKESHTVMQDSEPGEDASDDSESDVSGDGLVDEVEDDASSFSL